MFAFPAQSNVSGVQHSLAWIGKAQALGWDVLLDAAAFVPSSGLDLSVHRPEFVSLSFHKIFGYPTGIGCLLVKKTAFGKLRKPSFAGGTIALSAVTYSGYFLKQDHEKFENGTVNYLGIPAVANGLEFMGRIGMQRINDRIKELGRFLLSALTKLTHTNGKPLLKIYGPADLKQRGGTFLLNFFDVQGQQYPFAFIEQAANTDQICLRTGCFCNPGIDEINHALSAVELKAYFTSREGSDYDGLIHFLGKLRGAVRVSIGFHTTKRDLKKFIRFAKGLLNKTVPPEELAAITKSSGGLLQTMRKPVLNNATPAGS